MSEHYVVLRVPSSGPRAVVGKPWAFRTRGEAEARIAEIERDKLIEHHTHLDVVSLKGDLYAALESAGIIY